MKKIRVLEFELTENMGGVESLLCSVDKRINKKIFEIDFIATQYAPYQEDLKEIGSKIFLLPSIKKIILYVKSLNQILNNNYDIVHFNKNSLANSLPILISKYHPTHPKIIIHSHNTAPTHNILGLKFLHFVNKTILRSVPDYKIACSGEAKKWMFFSKDNVEIINNGIDTKKFKFSEIKRSKIRHKLGISDDTVLIGNVGRFNRQKNHVGLIKIFANLANNTDKYKLLLIGKGDEMQKIKSLVKENQLNKKVIFVDNTSVVDEYLSAMDIFLMPSLYEGLPLAAVEAQAAGLQVFVSDNISKEVYLTSYIYPISLKWDEGKISTFIKQKYQELNYDERKRQANVVHNKDFDLLDTTDKFEKVYENIIN